MGVTYDTGALVAADRGERRQWARHRALLARREIPTVPSTVLAQAWRGGSRQALLSRLLAGCDIEVLDDARARAAGTLAARAGTTDIVDASMVEGALRRLPVPVPVRLARSEARAAHWSASASSAGVKAPCSSSNWATAARPARMVNSLRAVSASQEL